MVQIRQLTTYSNLRNNYCFEKKKIVENNLSICQLSRKDNKTYICDDCGQAEAMKDYEAMLLKEIKGHE